MPACSAMKPSSGGARKKDDKAHLAEGGDVEIRRAICALGRGRDSERIDRAAAGAHQGKARQRDIGMRRPRHGADADGRKNKQHRGDGPRAKPIDQRIDEQARQRHAEGKERQSQSANEGLDRKHIAHIDRRPVDPGAFDEKGRDADHAERH